jgi:hypothetical protein
VICDLSYYSSSVVFQLCHVRMYVHWLYPQADVKNEPSLIRFRLCEGKEFLSKEKWPSNTSSLFRSCWQSRGRIVPSVVSLAWVLLFFFILYIWQWHVAQLHTLWHFHCISGYANAPQCYVIRTLPTLCKLAALTSTQPRTTSGKPIDIETHFSLTKIDTVILIETPTVTVWSKHI